MSDATRTWGDLIPEGDVAKFSGFANDINAFQQDFAPKNGGCPMRGFHVKAHAGLHARLRIGEVPVAARFGLLSAPKIWPAWVRISNGYSASMNDWFPDLVGFAVKVEGVPGPTLLPGAEDAHTQDFLALNRSFLPVRSADDLMVISLATKNFWTAPFALIRGLGVLRGLFVIGWTLSWSVLRLFLRSAVTSDFYGVVPISAGERPIKFRWVSRQTAGGNWFNGFRDFLRQDLRDRLRSDDLRFDLEVQLFVDAQRTPIDGGWRWPQRVAPWVKVGELTIPRCDIDVPAALADTARVDAMAFNPWHAAPAHRPQGNIQRARGLVYQRSAKLRGAIADGATDNGVQAPSPCPPETPVASEAVNQPSRETQPVP